MNLALFLPGAIVLLKAVLRASVDRQVSALAVIKGIIFLPVDLVFLTFSYLLATDLIARPDVTAGAFRIPFMVSVGFFLAAIVMIVACSKCDRLMDAGRGLMAACFSFLTYFVAVLILIGTLNMTTQ